MRRLKWDPLFGPVAAGQPADREASTGRPLPHGPEMQRQVGRSLIAQSADTLPGMAFDCSRPYIGQARLDVRFFDDQAHDDAFLGDFFAGVEDASERTRWLMDCYQAMHRRGLWPTNLPLEQLLADEEMFADQGLVAPPCPAGVQ